MGLAAAFSFFDDIFDVKKCVWPVFLPVSHPVAYCLVFTGRCCTHLDAKMDTRSRLTATEGGSSLSNNSSEKVLSHCAHPSSYTAWSQACIECKHFNSSVIQNWPQMENYLYFPYVSFFYCLILFSYILHILKCLSLLRCSRRLSKMFTLKHF